MLKSSLCVASNSWLAILNKLTVSMQSSEQLSSFNTDN